VKRGEIWWASLDEPTGSQPEFKRPVVIISSNDFNVSKIQTIIVVVITSNLRLAEAPGNIELPKKGTGLPRNSVINVSQLLTLDKSFLTKKIGKLPSKKLQSLNDGVRLVLSI